MNICLLKQKSLNKLPELDFQPLPIISFIHPLFSCLHSFPVLSSCIFNSDYWKSHLIFKQSTAYNTILLLYIMHSILHNLHYEDAYNCSLTIWLSLYSWAKILLKTLSQVLQEMLKYNFICKMYIKKLHQWRARRGIKRG